MKNYEERIDEEKAIFYHPLPPFRGGIISDGRFIKEIVKFG